MYQFSKTHPQVSAVIDIYMWTIVLYVEVKVRMESLHFDMSKGAFNSPSETVNNRR